MNAEQLDSTKVKLCNMIFMDVIEEAMRNKGDVNWESVELIAEDTPDVGDVMYIFSDNITEQMYRIFFKRSSVGKRGFQYELFQQIGKMSWKKIMADFKAIN